MSPTFPSVVMLLALGTVAAAPDLRFELADDSPARSVSDSSTPEAAVNAASIRRRHDRALLADLMAYLVENPDADDREGAALAIFEVAIEHDWFADAEPTASAYLDASPEGTVAPMARIVATMARARSGRFDEALASHRALIAGLEGVETLEFAANFTDSLAAEAAQAGKIEVARGAYDALLQKFGADEELAAKVRDDLERLAMVGRPAPPLDLTDIHGRPIRLVDLKGKYVLVDFWATWCEPCLAELPNQRASYERFHDRGFEIIGISLDDRPEDLSAFVEARKIPWPQAHDPSNAGTAVASYRVGNIPSSFLIGPDGKVLRLELRGPALGETLEKLLPPES